MIESTFNVEPVSKALYAYGCAVVEMDSAKQGEALDDLFTALDKVHEESKCMLCVKAAVDIPKNANEASLPTLVADALTNYFQSSDGLDAQEKRRVVEAEIVRAIAVAASQNESKEAAAANALRDACYDAAYKAGWWKVPVYGEPYSGRKEDIRTYPTSIVKWWIGTKIALIHSEVSEALEGARQDSADTHLPHLKSCEVEFADVIIRVMDLCGGLGIDIGRAIVEKLAYNAQRADHKPENREAVGGKAF